MNFKVWHEGEMIRVKMTDPENGSEAILNLKRKDAWLLESAIHAELQYMDENLLPDGMNGEMNEDTNRQ